MTDDITVERYLRGFAGAFILISMFLAYILAAPVILLFTAFVGINLLQSAYTNWCPMMWLLKKLL